MKVVALCVSKPVTITDKGREISTGIFKSPVDGARMVRRTNIDGDQQADLTVHGGPHKAVYAFPVEHYEAYRDALGQEDYPFGQFGENLTVSGLLETEVRIGDRYRAGEALLEVSQPRSPCFKFGIKMRDRSAIGYCLSSARTGFYYRVIEEGLVGAGDAITRESRLAEAPTVEAVHRLYYFDKTDREGTKRAVDCAALAPAFRDEFVARLAAWEETG